VLHGLTGAAHLNGTPGILVRVNSGSHERATVRLDDQRAVKCINYNRTMMC
jgi:hypothetical protein